MKYLFLSLLVGSATLSGMNSTENRQSIVEQDLISEVRRSMRSMYMRAFGEGDFSSREACNIINLLTKTHPLSVGLSEGAIVILQRYKFLDEVYKFDWDRIDAWNFIRSLGESNEECNEKEK